jgi:hypothetical protein
LAYGGRLMAIPAILPAMIAKYGPGILKLLAWYGVWEGAEYGMGKLFGTEEDVRKAEERSEMGRARKAQARESFALESLANAERMTRQAETRAESPSGDRAFLELMMLLEEEASKPGLGGALNGLLGGTRGEGDSAALLEDATGVSRQRWKAAAGPEVMRGPRGVLGG